jgi:phage-related protein
MFTDYYAQTTGETRAFLDGFISSVGDFVNNTIGMFSDFGGNVVSTFQDMWNNATNAVTTGIDTVIGWITGVGGRITGAIGDLGGLLAHAGQAIMDGFLGGLNAGFKGVQDMVGGVADWIAQHKGPEAYDRALLVPHGGWIMGGLKQGIEGSMGGLKQTLTNVTDLIKATMSDTTMAVNLTSSTPSNPNIFAAQSQGPVDIFAAAANAQSVGAGRTVITPTVNVYPSAPLNEKQVGQMAASELYWNFVNR